MCGGSSCLAAVRRRLTHTFPTPCSPPTQPARGIYFDMWQMQRAQAVLEEHLQHPADAGSASSSDEAAAPPAAVQAGEPR